jgi:uncharacterized protein with FMN-binding domain
MRKSLIIIFAVAVLGGLSFYVNNHKSDDSTAGAQPSSSKTSPAQASSGTQSSSGNTSYKDGTFTGKAAETPYGTVQIAAVISGGKISDIQFLQMPSEEMRSRDITANSEAQLKQNAISAQSSRIDFITGATSTSYGYQESLQQALNKAKQS